MSFRTRQPAATHQANVVPNIAVGPALFLAALLCVWISLEPFRDRAASEIAGIQGVSNILNQVVYPLIAFVVAGYVAVTKPRHFRPLIVWPYIVLFLWLIVVALASGEPATGLRRVFFEVIMWAIAASMLALPRDEQQFAGMLAAATSTVLLICYAGVLLLPSLAIHTTGDVLETELAGSWRGLFNHKNLAGQMMAQLFFCGLYIAAVKQRFLGWSIAAAALVFLVFTYSKTTLALVPVCLLLAFLIESTRRMTARVAIAVTCLIVMNLATIGSSWPGLIRNTVGLVISDVTFTSRTDLWKFSAENIANKPVFGHGLGGFWRTDEMMYQDKLPAEPEDISGWVTELGTDSHNAYLEAALQLGLPGLGLLLIAVIAVPLRDYAVASRERSNEHIVRLFLRIWIFTLYLATLETVLLARNMPVWFTMLIAIFGLRILSVYRIPNERTRR